MPLLLIDGTYELFRAHYSRRPDRTDPSGRDVKATVGVVGAVLGLLAEVNSAPIHVAAAFDRPIESFRNDRFPGYKDSRGMPAELLAQFELVEQAVVAIGVTVWSMDRWEADDALATAAVRFASEVDQVRIVTPDKDLAQVVADPDIVQVDQRQGRTYDVAGVRARLGVAPPSVPDYLALVGDTADGIPGLPGFGAKTAAALLARYGHLEAIPRDGDDWEVAVRGAARLAATLRDRRDDVLLYRDLATLRTDVPLAGGLDDLRWEGVPRAEFLRWCDELAVDHLRTRPHRWADAQEASGSH